MFGGHGKVLKTGSHLDVIIGRVKRRSRGKMPTGFSSPENPLRSFPSMFRKTLLSLLAVCLFVPLAADAAKGTKVELEGVKKVEGHDAYKLKLTLKGGQVEHVWVVDAQNFLEVKLSGSPRRMDGKMRNVYIYMRDYRSQQGLMIPDLLETSVEGYKETHKTVIESVLVNPRLGGRAVHQASAEIGLDARGEALPHRCFPARLTGM
jgi:hypothetical protein